MTTRCGTWCVLLTHVIHIAWTFETWHLVDIAGVVCPLPTGGTCTDCGTPPTPGNYSVGIELESTMAEDAPYILSFLRTTNQSLSVTYEVRDATGREIVTRRTQTLIGRDSSTVPASCQCSGQRLPQTAPNYSLHPADYGTSCYQWDQADCDNLNSGNLNLGDWCCDKWCYADATCPDAVYSEKASTDGSPVYFSYQVCPDQPTGECSWNAQTPPAPCECRNIASLMNATTASNFPGDYGSKCFDWDITDCDQKFRPESLDSWCCDKWCYVSSECSSAQPSLLQDNLFWASTGVCIAEPEALAQCPYTPVITVDADTYAACACLEESPPNTVRPEGSPVGYGATCSAWDEYECENYYPDSIHDMWCCDTWCYVDKNCPGATNSLFWPGHYTSTTGCLATPATAGEPYTYTWQAADSLSMCAYSDACDCLDPNSGTPLSQDYQDGLAHAGNMTSVSDYGVDCAAHDGASCSDLWSTTQALWGADKNWCCDSWCYVSFDCPIADASYFGAAVPPYSYATCDDLGPQQYDEDTDTCSNTTRRLGSSLQQRGTPPEVQERRLAARRRSGGSYYSSPSRRRSSYSSPSRRRSSPSRRRRAPSRRRAPPRRRAPVRRRRSSPDRRRRTSSYTQPAAPSRRRRSTPNRRRGSTPTRRRRTGGPTRRRAPPRRRRNLRRRVPPSPPVGAPRRRGVPQPSIQGQPYGYGSETYMYSNYGNRPPYSTDYGYSGGNAYSTGSTSRMALYAAGGAAAGAAVGAGAMYMYYSRYDNPSYTWYRRRRLTPAQWCLEPQGMMRIMECSYCDYRYGLCNRASNCYDASGCTYQTGEDFGRDDLEGAAFLPQDWVWPISVYITDISGPSVITSGEDSICPPTTEQEMEYWEDANRTMTYQAELFVTLTQMDIVGGGSDPQPGSDDAHGIAVSTFLMLFPLWRGLLAR